MPQKRTRRTADERIADLRAEIDRIKARAALAEAKKDPARRHIAAAIRAIDKATAETEDAGMQEALSNARATLSGCLAIDGEGPGTLTPRRRRVERPDADRVLAYIREHPGARSTDICSELDTDTASLRPVLHGLRDAGAISVEGKARATRYSAIG